MTLLTIFSNNGILLSMKKTSFLKINITLPLAFGLFSCIIFCCASNKNIYKDIDHAVEGNNFPNAVNVIKQSQETGKPIYSEKNAIMLFLDKGLLEHYAGDYSASSNSLQEAERLIEDAYTKSITADITSYMVNDNVKEYPGEDFEDIYINVFNALNFYKKGDIDGALVEIRKLTMTNKKLDTLEEKYADMNSGAVKDVFAKLLSLGFSEQPDIPKGSPVNFSNSALARYLSYLFYLGDGKEDSARIELKQLEAAFASNPKIYYNPYPGSIAEINSVPNNKARLNIIGFTGLSPIKQEVKYNQVFPFFENLVLRYPQFKLPKLFKRPSQIDRIEVVINGKDKIDLELLEDMGAVIEETYNASFSRIFLKTYIRTMLKYALIDIAAVEAKKYAKSDIAAITAVASALAAKTAFDASESADVRMTRYLPDKAYIGGINLDPGTYKVTVNFYSGSSAISKIEYNDVQVMGKNVNIIEAVSLK